ncbi:acetylhydrolase [Clostridium botulinum C/D str. BKT12695]|nr:acetylhydrolase [Clostridium botulinum C/D str. BKT12695]NEZ49245.1 acetylhydrolase [Clostridium botulinum]
MSKRRIKIKNFKKFFINMICIFIVILCISLVITHKIGSNKISVSAEVSNKKELNNKVQNGKVDKIKNNNLEEKKKSEEILSENKPKENNVPNKVYFKDSLFLGDSIIEAMSFFDALDEKNVMGIIGLTIKKAISNVDKIKNQNPNELFILLGHNDLENDMEMSMNNYTKLINKLKKEMPNTKIYVQGVLPVTEKASQKHKYLLPNNINDFNRNLKEVCEREDVKFVDLLPMFKNIDKGIYEPDGIHFKEPFYKMWLDYLKINYK